MAAINLDIGGNTSRLDRDIQKTVNKAYSINLKTKGDQPLGRITGKVNEFNKSLDASNARVIAFGASAGIIFGLQRAFSSLVTSTIEVQKSLQDINVILNVSTTQLNKFGSELFNIAKNTGQSFQEVAGAATEFSRQGLGLVETLKRTNEALILSRLSGLDTVKSVQALTAAVNSFASQAVTATEVVNKFANVDAAFAVSSADLADALSRVGSSAAQSGVSLNELIALVTSAQQTTARGGAVIGNSFKTIFTRLQRGKVVDLLGTLGISDTTAGGEIKSTIQLLQELGAVYDNLGAQQQAYVAEQVGGVFQINILKAALADLGKEYSVYSSALSTAEASTDQAIKRNEQLNKTYAAQLNALQQNAKQLAAGVGNRVLGPVFDRVVGGANELLGGINESDGKGVGAVLGKGILDGLGQLLAGPGLVLIGGILLKLTKDFAKFGLESGKSLLGLNSAATQQKNLQESIGQILQNNPKLIDLALKSEQGLNQVANSLYATLQKQTLELQNQEKISQRIAKAFYGAGVRSSGGVPIVPTSGKSGKSGKATGYIPNFAEVSQAIELGAPSSVQSVSGVGKIGGKSFEANNKEFQIPDFAGTGETAVIPKYGGGIKEATKMIARGESGSVLDKSDRNRARGFVPNFAQKSKRGYSVLDGDSLVIDKDYPDKRLQGKEMRLESVDAIESWQKYGEKGSPNAKSLAKSIINKEFPNLDSALKSSGKTEKAAYDRPYFNSKNLQEGLIKQGLGVPDLRYGSTLKGLTMQVMNKPIGLWSDKNKDGFYNHPKAQQFIKQNNLEKKLSSRKDLRQYQKNYILGTASNWGSGRYKGELLPDVIKSKGKPGSKNYRSERAYDYQRLARASGFIPNFAQTKKAIDLGNLDTIPNNLGNKVVSLIYPGLSDGYTLSPATASYLKQEYTGKIPVAGINQTKLKSQIPDLDKNLGDLLVKEANQFGQSLGGTNFLKSAEDLPNYGAAKGAVGVAFEGGVQTLLQQKVGRKQNAGIDFRNITPRLRSIFNEAPGMYDAKSSPALTNEVFKKLLNETRPGATVQKSSGQAGKDYVAKRSAAVAELKKEGITGSVAIRQALKNRFGIVGKAAGYIPNFAAIQDAVSRERAAGIPSNQIYLAQEQALTSANPMGLGVFNKKDEPTKGSRKDAMRKKGFARGFIPNFAEDVSAAPIGASIAALVAQLGTLAFFLKDIRSDMETSHKEAIETATNEISQDKAKLDSLKKGTAEHDKLNKKIKSSTESLKKMDSTASKVGSGLLASASTIMIAAPMLAALAKNAVGSETKGARAAGAAIEGTGQAFSFASMASMLGNTRKSKGVYAALAFLAASALTTAGAITEYSTDLPELARAAEKASQKLSEFENIGQQANISLEQITDLRNKGQAKEAGAVEGRILTDIAKQVTDPNVAAQMQRAVINKDSEALRVAIEENSKILREERDKTDMSAAIQAGITGIESQTGGYLSKGNAEKQISEARTIFTAPLLDLKSATLDESGKEVRSTGIERFNQLQNFGRMNESGGTEDFRKILEELGYKGEDLNRLLEKEAILRGPLQKLINEQIESQANQLRNTEEGNSVVKQISDAMRNVRSKYDEYAKAITQGVNNQISANSDIKNALARIEVGRLESNAEITEAFTGSGSTATRQSKTRSEFAKIDSDFTSSINEPITEATRTLFDVLQSSVSSKIGTMATPGKDQNSAVMNFETLQASLLPLLESLNIENLQGILPSANEDFQGFDVKKIIDGIRQEVGEAPGEDVKKGLETLEKQLNTANSTLYEQRRIQQEQKVLLAQQKFTEIAKLFIAGIRESMGGFEAFLKDNFSENSQALQDAAANIRIIGSNPETRGGQIEVGRNLGIVTTELSKLSGLNIGEELAKFAPNVIAQIEGGQSKYIEDNLNTVFNSLAGLDEGIAQAFRASLGKKFGGLGEDASNKEIADATAKAQTSMQYQLMPAMSESIRKASIEQLKKGNEGDQKMAELLETDAGKLFVEDPQSQLILETQRGNDLLQGIIDAINTPIQGSPPATTTPGYGGPAYDSGGAAGGFFPAFANSKESIIPNFKQQYEKEKRDQSKYGYSGGKPLPLSEENFNPLRDAIANPMQMALLGGMKSKSLGAAGGYFPNFAIGSSFLNRAKEILGIDPTGTAVASAAEGAGKANKAGKNRPPAKSSKKGPRGKGKNSRRPTPRGPDGRFIPKPGPNASGKTPTGMIANLAKGAKGYGKNVMKAVPGLGMLYSAGMGIKDYNENTKAGMDSSEAMVRAISDFALGTAGGAIGSTIGGLAGLIGGGGVFSAPLGIGGALLGGGLGYTGGTYLSRLLMDSYYGPKDRMKVDPTANPSTRPPPGATLKAKKLEMQKRNVKKFEKPDKKQLDEIKQAMGPDLPSPKERTAIADRDNQAQLIRWQMGASAAFKNYDKDGVSTGIKSMYGQGGGQEVKGSNIDITRQLTETTKALKASKSPRESMALARKASALRQQIQSGILPKSEFIGKQGEGMGAQTLINEAIAKGQTINAIDPKKPETGRKLSESNLEGLQRTITGKDGKVIGYSRYNPEASKYREYSGSPGVYVDDKLWTPPEERNKILVGGKGDMPAKQVNAKTGKSMQVPRAMPAFKMGGAATELGTQIPNPAADFAKLERTKDKEQEEAGVPRSQIYSLDLPEVVTPDNPDGTAVFNKEDERSVEDARRAVERVYSFGKIRTPTNNAGGYFPNFAEPSSTSNNVNVSVGVNITAGASASSIDKDALSAQIQTLLEVEVPKLNALQARVDRMGEVVTKVQEGNPGKYNLPPKQIPK